MMPEAQTAPPVQGLEAISIADSHYGLRCAAQRLPGEYDDNFHLLGADGSAFVLKIMHSARERSFIEMQCAALQHLQERAPHLSLPRVLPAKDGQIIRRVTLADGDQRFVWMLTFLPGTVLAKIRPHSSDLLESLGRFLGEMDTALQDFSHPAAARSLKWDLAQAGWIRKDLQRIQDTAQRQIIEKVLALYDAEAAPALPNLRHSVIYGDANDYNVLVGVSAKAVSVIDFGDMHHTATVCEIAIAAAYALLEKDNPLQAASAVIAGYHQTRPLDDAEIAVLFPLLAMRLAVSVVNSAQRKALVPDDPYITVSEAPAWAALEKLAQVHPRFAHYMFRVACGRPAVPGSIRVAKWLAENAAQAAPVIGIDLRIQPVKVFDLSVGSVFLGANPENAQVEALSNAIFAEMKKADVKVGVGRYDEARLLYTSPLFSGGGKPTDERRTIHLGIDLFCPAGTPVYAPLDGTVHIVAHNAAHLDYGPVVILKHSTGDGVEFFTLYGHLSIESLSRVHAGDQIAKGQKIASLGKMEENGGWPPHLHFQIIVDLLDYGSDFPGVGKASERSVWLGLSPGPNLLLGIPAERFPESDPGHTGTMAARKALLGPNLSVSYKRPLKIVRGWRQYLYDETGRAYLDVFNNVPLVGHSHPRVVRAVQEQLGLLNTNTRYLHDNVVRYAGRLTRRLPGPLRSCYFVNSGSEANELALRMARARTGRKDVIVLEHAYHGNTSTLIDISPYKFGGPGGHGRKPWVHVAPIADDYRGLYRQGEADLGIKYARHVAEILEELRAQGGGPATYIAESLPSIAGQVVFPPGYLGEVYRHVRAAGGVCIADEVQVGFGRLGSHFWGFESQNVIPDIVVMGKPIGNAFPLAAVVTTPEVAAAFDNGMEYFNTFGGNPVACAAGLAVLDVVEGEDLQANALRVGNYLMEKLKAMQAQYPLIGEVRGAGLFLGIDLVLDRETREPATQEAKHAVNRLRDLGILAGTDGPHENVIKLRPALIFSEADAELFVETLGEVLGETRISHEFTRMNTN
ncbi:MAG TPA: aminotransferase class III-fold pyridoxal phosphate-dependent enzyme [Candidatus Saccharimonadales bacterium]|jgi:4-aminobutyrate aminotransferase-like enzyme/Ser/Thr protein kinase RdoA (MazF antagonist)|nr:aminotransferase class III-fold pyridoxal phosphate-dependent enzyme [Candidatus Saccharimonadales bacterium]